MSLKLTYFGQNDGSTVPDVVLTGDPGTDQATLTAAGFLGGVIVALRAPVSASNTLVAITPCDAHTMIPYATLLNGPGEFAGAIGPSGSQKAPVVRAMWQGIVDSQGYDTTANNPTFVLGAYLYCGGSNASHNNTGKYTDSTNKGDVSGNPAIGICTHVPTTAEPWLGVASLL